MKILFLFLSLFIYMSSFIWAVEVEVSEEEKEVLRGRLKADVHSLGYLDMKEVGLFKGKLVASTHRNQNIKHVTPLTTAPYLYQKGVQPKELISGVGGNAGWSSGGTKLVFSKSAIKIDNGKYTDDMLVVCDANGKVMEKQKVNLFFSHMDLSADGKKVVYVSTERRRPLSTNFFDRIPEIYIYNLESKEYTKIYEIKNNYYMQGDKVRTFSVVKLRFSPDASKIFFTVSDGKNSAYVIDLKGEILFHDENVSTGSGDWFPDGKHLALEYLNSKDYAAIQNEGLMISTIKTYFTKVNIETKEKEVFFWIFGYMLPFAGAKLTDDGLYYYGYNLNGSKIFAVPTTGKYMGTRFLILSDDKIGPQGTSIAWWYDPNERYDWEGFDEEPDYKFDESTCRWVKNPDKNFKEQKTA